MSPSVSGGCIRVMMEPGFRAGASAIQRARCAESLGNMPPAMVVRLPTWVRLGPITPGDTPWITWQPMHAERPYTVLPCAARLRWGGRSEEHTSELQSHVNLVCRLLLEKKKNTVMTQKPSHGTNQHNG